MKLLKGTIRPGNVLEVLEKSGIDVLRMSEDVDDIPVDDEDIDLDDEEEVEEESPLMSFSLDNTNNAEDAEDSLLSVLRLVKR